MLRLISLSWRNALREIRSGELTVLVAALVIAVASSTTVGILSDRLNRTMTQEAAEFLAADLVVSGHDPAPAAWVEHAEANGLSHAETVEFPSVLVVEPEILLAGIKAISSDYPLRGTLMISGDDPATEHAATDVPEPGTAWVERRVLSHLHLQLGATIEIGEQEFRITHLVTREPDPRGELYSLSPRVMINLVDLPATRVIQPGSHAHYYALFAGDEKVVRSFGSWLKPQLHPGQRIIDVHDDRPEVGNALKRAQRYLGMTTIAVILIAGSAIAMSVRRYTERHYDFTALLKCFGLAGRSILAIYLLQFLIIGLAASMLGCLLGALLQELAAYLLSDLLPRNLALPGLFSVFFGVASGLLILFGFALPPLLRLQRCTPLRVLRRDLEPTPSRAITVYGAALAVLGGLLWRATDDARMTAIIIAGGTFALGVFGYGAWLLLRLAERITDRFGIAWRFALRRLTHSPGASVGQTLAFGITFVAMLLALLVRTELIGEWQRQLPSDAPNHFALNLFESDRAQFREFLDRERLSGSAFYPIVRGRLTKVGGIDVQQRGPLGSMAESALNRDLSLTWAADLPDENVLVKGRWWSGDQSVPLVSVEEKLATDLDLRLGNRLTFNIAGLEREARIASFRRVRWDTMMPNFFMILSPGSLDDQPHTYLTSFFVPPDRKDTLLRLTKAFPAVSLLEVDRLLAQLQMILRQISGAVGYVLVFALAAGFTLLFAAVRASLDSRLYDDAVMRAVGAPNALLQRSLWLEFGTLGFLAGLMAAALAETIANVLYGQVFNISGHWHPEYWLLLPPCAALIIGLAGYLHTRARMAQSPLSIFREL